MCKTKNQDSLKTDLLLCYHVNASTLIGIALASRNTKRLLLKFETTNKSRILVFNTI